MKSLKEFFAIIFLVIILYAISANGQVYYPSQPVVYKAPTRQKIESSYSYEMTIKPVRRFKWQQAGFFEPGQSEYPSGGKSREFSAFTGGSTRIISKREDTYSYDQFRLETGKTELVTVNTKSEYSFTEKRPFQGSYRPRQHSFGTKVRTWVFGQK